MKSDKDNVVNLQANRDYQRGYAAGRKRAEAEASDTGKAERERAFWQKVYTESLQYFLGCVAWTRGNEKLTSLDDRCGLAAKAADKALEHARKSKQI